MEALSYWKAVVRDSSNLLESFVRVLEESGVRYCIIGGQGVNAYAEPVVSLDLDVAVVPEDLGKLEAILDPVFRVERFSHSVNVTLPGSDLRAQLQIDPRYSTFPDRAERRTVLGLELWIASIEDVLQGKIWAATDVRRRASKRQKDLADIARLVEVQPELRERLPEEVLSRLI